MNTPTLTEIQDAFVLSYSKCLSTCMGAVWNEGQEALFHNYLFWATM